MLSSKILKDGAGFPDKTPPVKNLTSLKQKATRTGTDEHGRTWSDPHTSGGICSPPVRIVFVCSSLGDPLAPTVCGLRMGWFVTTGAAYPASPRLRRGKPAPVVIPCPRSSPFKSVTAPQVLLLALHSAIGAKTEASFHLSSFIVHHFSKKRYRPLDKNSCRGILMV